MTITRREALHTGGAFAGLTLAGSYALAVDTAPRKLRIGIVGGHFGLSFFWHVHPDCVVEAVSDLRPERRNALMKTYNCAKSYPSLAELVKDPKVEAVGIFTDGPLHVEHAELALAHGKHVITAVPAAWGTLDQCHRLHDAVKKSGLHYMMAETSVYQQHSITAQKFHQQKLFGEIIYCESEYQHDGLQALYFEGGKRTWRHGVAPMHYPTHCTAHLISVTGERLTQVTCAGWGDGDPILKDNVYKNPFWNESAMFRTDKGHAFRVNVWWKGAFRNFERAQWIGTNMSFYTGNTVSGPVILRKSNQMGKDAGGFPVKLPEFENYKQTLWWKTDLLPEPLRRDSGHEGSHTFITHEFVDAVTHDRTPKVNVHEALAYTAPGIVAHESALKDGELLKIPSFD